VATPTQAAQHLQRSRPNVRLGFRLGFQASGPREAVLKKDTRRDKSPGEQTSRKLARPRDGLSRFGKSRTTLRVFSWVARPRRSEKFAMKIRAGVRHCRAAPYRRFQFRAVLLLSAGLIVPHGAPASRRGYRTHNPRQSACNANRRDRRDCAVAAGHSGEYRCDSRVSPEAAAGATSPASFTPHMRAEYLLNLAHPQNAHNAPRPLVSHTPMVMFVNSSKRPADSGITQPGVQHP
jgi:hypothetical protein